MVGKTPKCPRRRRSYERGPVRARVQWAWRTFRRSPLRKGWRMGRRWSRTLSNGLECCSLSVFPRHSRIRWKVMLCSIQVWCFCLSLCYVWFAAITYVVDLGQAQEREEFLRKKYCVLLKEKEQLCGPEL